ncbi:MAG: hypothetical protein PHG51_06420 [Candidatus Omnitrophica bacterium]|nr:hypothetical protein [Candidatus Omnitrophota bacterium]
MDDLITIAQAAKLLKKFPMQVYRLVVREKLDSVTVAGITMVSKAAVEALPKDLKNA